MIVQLSQFKMFGNGMMSPFPHFVSQQRLVSLGDIDCYPSSQFLRRLKCIFIAFDLLGYQIPLKHFLSQNKQRYQACLKLHEILTGVVISIKFIHPEWFHRFVNIVDLCFLIPAVAIEQWPSKIHEGLTIGIYFPHLINSPYN